MRSAKLVSRGALARPPLRATEVYVSRKTPLAVAFKRCLLLLRGPHSFVSIRGAGACVAAVLHVTQDLVAAFGGQISYSVSVDKEECDAAMSTSGSAVEQTAGAAAEGAAAAAAEVAACGLSLTSSLSFEQRAAAVFAASAAKLSYLGSSGFAPLTIAAEAVTAVAHDEVTALGPGGDPTLQAAGIDLELRVSTKPLGYSS